MKTSLIIQESKPKFSQFKRQQSSCSLQFIYEQKNTLSKREKWEGIDELLCTLLTTFNCYHLLLLKAIMFS